MFSYPLLEGDCVGPTWPILKPGSREPGFFLERFLAGLSPARLFLARFLESVVRIFHMMNFATPRSLIDNGTSAPHHRQMITNPCATAMVKKASLPGALDRRAR
jgi:hypothetical protein